MSEELSDGDRQMAGSTPSPVQAPERRSFFPVVCRIVVVAGILFAVVEYQRIPIVSSAVSVLSCLLGLVQMRSVEDRVEANARSIYNHLDTRWQHLANIVGRLWQRRLPIVSVLLSFIVIGFLLKDIVLPGVLSRPVPRKLTLSLTATPAYTLPVSDSASVGLSDGLVNFDTVGRLDGDLKVEASRALAVKDSNKAGGYWQLARREDETDGELCIYQEDQNVAASLRSASKDYVTLVVVVTLTGGDRDTINIGRSILQGACVAQKEYNSQRKLPNGLPVRLQVANIDDPTLHGHDVAKLISQMAANDPTFVGVIGQLAGADDLVQDLNKAGILMISSTALYSNIVTSSLFSVAPSLQQEAQAAANEAIQFSKQAGVFYDPSSSYDTVLRNSFVSQFMAAGGTILPGNTYTSGSAAETLSGRVDDMMSAIPAPTLIYLAGSPDDASFLVPYVHARWPDVRVMGGDILYQYVHSSDTRSNFDGLLFTSFAFHDEWQGRVAKPAFFGEYTQNFDSQKQHSGNPFTYRLPDSDAILAYDAAGVLLQAGSMVGTKQKLTADAVGQKLKGHVTFAGISGPISFGPDGEPQDKAIVVLQPESQHIQLIAVQGRYP